MKALLDTNILIDYLNGIPAAREEIKLYPNPCISIISWMEVMVGAEEAERPLIEGFLNQFDLLNVTHQIAQIAVEIRKSSGIKLPDAIIWASARSIDALLVTRNTRDFPASSPGIRLPYQI